jgi:hypothetical protein
MVRIVEYLDYESNAVKKMKADRSCSSLDEVWLKIFTP